MNVSRGQVITDGERLDGRVVDSLAGAFGVRVSLSGLPLTPTYIQRHAPSTQHPTPYTLHPTPQPEPEPDTIHNTQYTIHNTQYNPHHTPHTPTPHNPHPTPHTTHPTPNTQHPTPHTLTPNPPRARRRVGVRERVARRGSVRLLPRRHRNHHTLHPTF